MGESDGAPLSDNVPRDTVRDVADLAASGHVDESGNASLAH